ncbi:ribosome maturation factor [Desulfovibrio sp. OttesenSCG-928-I05]|nr:ribosome maturation factor [Desulfovibrio sp. OttesenSCG-928-I05]
MTAPAPNITERLLAIAAPLVESLGLQIWGLEFIPGGRSIVRLYIDGEDGATIDQCADISRLFGLSLEVEDILPDAYVLEVSSPGLERVFFAPEQLVPYAGNGDYLELSLLQPTAGYPGRRKFNGKLLSAADGLFTLLPEDPGAPAKAGNGENEELPLVTFTWGDIKKIRRIHFVPAPDKPKKGKTAKPPLAAKNKKTPRAGEDSAVSSDADETHSTPNTGSGGSE